MLTRPHDDNVLRLLNVADEDVLVLSSITVLALDVALSIAVS